MPSQQFGCAGFLYELGGQFVLGQQGQSVYGLGTALLVFHKMGIAQGDSGVVRRWRRVAALASRGSGWSRLGRPGRG
jgi:hypothetical protein